MVERREGKNLLEKFPECAERLLALRIGGVPLLSPDGELLSDREWRRRSDALETQREREKAAGVTPIGSARRRRAP